MAEREDPRPRGRIRRILVALDASADSVAGLEAAADLAAPLGAELLGLFVEDLNLVRLPTLSFATEIDSLSGEPRQLAPAELERHLRQRAERARRSLEQTAGRSRVRWSFRTVRGRVTTELLAAEADLIAIGTRGHTPRRGPGSTAADVLARARTPVLVLRRGARLGRAVYAVDDGSEAAEAGIAVAGEIARSHGSPLTVLALGGGGEARPEVAKLLQDLREGGTPVRLEPFPGSEPDRLAEALRRRGCGLLVVPRTAEPAGRESLQELVRRSHCPVLVVG
jgi:nucleotide-binding universal stress UspA family protein